MKPVDFFPKRDVKVAWRRWEAMPSLMSLCPIVLGNGLELTELSVSCPTCQKDGHASHMRGDLKGNGEGGYRLRTIMWCQACNLLSYTRADILPKDNICEIVKDDTPPYWSPWGEDNTSIRGGFGG